MKNKAFWKNAEDDYLYLYASCFVTSGVERFSILDSIHSKMYTFDNDLHPLLTSLREKTIKEVIAEYEDDDLETVWDFLNFLNDKDLVCPVKDISCFCEMEVFWDAPRRITNSIIDVRDLFHDFKAIFSQLSELGCRYIEIRSYRELDYKEIKTIQESLSKDDNIGCLNIVLPFSKTFALIEIDRIIDLIKEEFRLNFSVYGLSYEEKENLSAFLKINPYGDAIKTSMQNITGCNSCGNIEISQLSALSVDEYMENRIYNGCLNRKISIDENGYIKNCPSMVEAFGNIEKDKLADVCSLDSFKKYWLINKEQIDTCSVCEYRSVCKDCRAYIVDENNILSKPLKCNYNPYNKTQI